MSAVTCFCLGLPGLQGGSGRGRAVKPMVPLLRWCVRDVAEGVACVVVVRVV